MYRSRLFRRRVLRGSGQHSRPLVDGRLLLTGGLNYDTYLVVDNDPQSREDLAALGDERIRQIRVEHNGGAVARSIGMEQATGDVVVTLEDDVLDLDDTQQQDLKLALYYYQQQRDDLFAKSLSKVDGKWLELDRRFESLVFSRVLNEPQRAKLADLRQPQQLDFTTVQR